MTFREWLIRHDACDEALEWVNDKTVEQAWAECPREDWMIWLVYELYASHHQDHARELYSNIIHQLNAFWEELQPSWIAASRKAYFRREEAAALLSGLRAAFIRSIQPTAPGPEL